MARIFDTLTTKLADLKQVRRDTDTAIEPLERYLRMGAGWINEREAEMAEMFAHLFPAAYAEPMVEVPDAALDEALARPKVWTAVTEWFDRRVRAPRRVLPDGIFVTERRNSSRRAVDFVNSIQARIGDSVPLIGDTPNALTFHAIPMTETVRYADGTSATGISPLPAVSPGGAPAVQVIEGALATAS